MKTIATVTACLLSAVFSAMAQNTNLAGLDATSYFSRIESYRSMDLQKTTKSYSACLESDNDGVVESALAHITHMRLMLPAVNLREFSKTIETLCSTGRTPAIRYKAYLASMVYSSPIPFTATVKSEYQNGNDFFAAIDSQLRHSVFGLNE